jgi:hypothetical protein
MKITREELLTKAFDIKFQTLILISSEQHFYKNLFKMLNQITTQGEQNDKIIANVFLVNTTEKSGDFSFYNFTLTHGSVLTPTEIHNAFSAFENKWHDADCSICKNLLNIQHELPKQVDVLIVDTNDFISYFEYKKIIDTCNCKEQYFIESKNQISLFNNL